MVWKATWRRVAARSIAATSTPNSRILYCWSIANSGVIGWMSETPAVQVNASRTWRLCPWNDSANGDDHCWTFPANWSLGPKAPRTSARCASAPRTANSLDCASGFSRSATATQSVSDIVRGAADCAPATLATRAMAIIDRAGTGAASRRTPLVGLMPFPSVKLLGEDRHVDGETGSELHVRRDVDPRDLHRETLDNFDEVARRVVRGQERKARARTRRGALDLPFEGPPRERIDGDLRALSGAHVANLGLLEVGDHVRRVRHDADHLLASLHELPFVHGEAREQAVCRRQDARVRELEPGLRERR